ncbi:hypothetical protein PR048_025063 [Dryococelus australis]|uniref:Uncharacterized protein n=1 Tax=Dryococelus australis TaxID=614101 RepID=A0ABQ9GQF0_9NEOP|nr:hypothetical protein PR048_025063 [Dryococelus australis]
MAKVQPRGEMAEPEKSGALRFAVGIQASSRTREVGRPGNARMAVARAETQRMERFWADLNIGVLRVIQGEVRRIWSNVGTQARLETEYLRGNPRTSGIVRHDFHTRTRRESNPVRLGEQLDHYTTAAPTSKDYL